MTTAEPPAHSLHPYRFEPVEEAVTRARHRLLDFLRLYDVPEETRDVAALLVTELTTNAVTHAGTHFALCAELTGSSLRVEVADGTTDLPVVLHSRPDEGSGRGMWLVSEMADNWGTEPIPDGKLVWFALLLR